MKGTYDLAWRSRVLAGEASAIALLADDCITPLYRFCLYRVGRDKDLCEDVVQETLTQAIREVAKYDPGRAGGNIFGWLTGLARNHIQRQLSRKRGTVSLEALWERMDRELLEVYARLDSQPFADELIEREETREMVNITMSQLPPHYREALEAKYVEGRSVREIADGARISEKAAESLLTRAREAFKATFLALAKNLNIEAIAT